MKKIGLTGGIGVGKTYVAKIFQNMNIPVFNADIEAKKCMDKNQAIKMKIISKFGKIEDTFASITNPSSKKFIYALEKEINK